MAPTTADIMDRLDTLVDSQQSHHVEVVQRITALETKFSQCQPGCVALEARVRALEENKAKLLGVMIAVTAAGSLLGGGIFDALRMALGGS